MNRILLIGAIAISALAFTGCENSSSDNNSNGQLQNTGVIVDNTFCTTNPQANECLQQQNQMQQFGLSGAQQNSNGQYQGSEFGLYVTGACGCPQGTQVAFDDVGNLYCGSTVSTVTTNTYLSFSFRNGKKVTHKNGQKDVRRVKNRDVVFELEQFGNTQETRVSPIGDCQQQARKVCTNHGSCSGFQVQNGQYSTCSPVQGQQYGYCGY